MRKIKGKGKQGKEEGKIKYFPGFMGLGIQQKKHFFFSSGHGWKKVQ